MKKLIMFVMVLAIAAPSVATRFPHVPPEFAGCANSGMVFWEFIVDGCNPTTNLQATPYVFDPALPNPTFGTRYEEGGPVWTWSAGDGGTGIYTCDDEDSLNGSIPVRGEQIYLRMYFQVVHTIVESDDDSLIGMGLELWDMGDWLGCPEPYEDTYLEGYEFPVPTSSVNVGGVWWKSIWVADFSTDGAVWSFPENPDNVDREFFDLFDATHITAIIAMGDYGAYNFDIEEVVQDYIWYSKTDGSDIPDTPCWGIKAPIIVETVDIPVYEPQDIGGPPPMGPTSGTIKVKLAWQPGSPTYPNFKCKVRIDPNSSSDSGKNPDISFTNPVPPDPNGDVTLTFTQANYNVFQDVTVAATEDLWREGQESSNMLFTVTIDIADCNFGGPGCEDPVTQTQGIIVVDNDIPYISVLPVDPCKPLVGTLSENTPGVPVCVNVTLSHKPCPDPCNPDTCYDVEVRGQLASGYDILLDMVVMDPNFEDWTDPNNLLFTSGNYNVNQTICLTALDDDIRGDGPDEDGLEWIPGVILLNALSDDIRYQSVEEDGELEETEIDFDVQDNECGSWGYDPLDVNEDCAVNLADFANYYEQWLGCTYKDGRSGTGVAEFADCEAAWGSEEE